MKRWTASIDLSFGLVAASWVAVLAVADPDSTWRWVVPLVLAVLVVQRVLLLIEQASPEPVPLPVERRADLSDAA